MNLPLPLNIFKPMINLSFKASGIDPYYTRFSSNFILKFNDGTFYEGTGIMEIMDLQ